MDCGIFARSDHLKLKSLMMDPLVSKISLNEETNSSTSWNA